ncbi:protein Shroom1-like [Narcine bancroftii]|uniref:protein Shroom1-like n=1 Tax=Narcine bancroftii TaxID=1343680 RepID=UPI003831857A
MDRLDQKGAANSASHFPYSHTGCIDQFRHQYGEGDSGFGSFFTSSAEGKVSLVHCNDRPQQMGNIFYQGRDLDTLHWTGTKATSDNCHTDVGNEKSSVFLTMENCHRECKWSGPPPPPTRHDSLLVIRQLDGSHPQAASQSSIGSRTPVVTFENDHLSKETSSFPLDTPLPNMGEAYLQTSYQYPSLKDGSNVPEKHSQRGEDAGNFTPKRVEKAPQSNITNFSLSFPNHGHGIAFDGVESRKQIHSLPLAHGQKPVPDIPPHPELPSRVMCSNVSECSQKTAPNFQVTNTHVQPFTTESRLAKDFPGSFHVMCPKNTTKGQSPKVHYKFYTVSGYKDRQRSLSETSARHLLYSPPGLDNNARSRQIFPSGSNEHSHIFKTHLSMTEPVQVRKPCSQRQIRNGTGSVGHRVVACPEARNNCNVLENHLKPANESSTHGTVTAETTPMLQRLAFQTTNVVKGLPMSAKQEHQLSGGQKDMQGEREKNQDLCKALENKMTQLRKCKNSSQLLNEHVELDQLNEESPGTSGSSIISSKNAYRNQVKQTQSKVLKETSFKRKDLQLSWPNQGKQKATGRSGITRFQTVSLPDQICIPDDPMATSASQILHGNQRAKTVEPQHQATQKGSRKRLTLVEKKMYHSEPEKINQLGVGCSPRKWQQAETFKFPDVQGKEATSRRQQFKAVNTSQMTLKEIQHQALVQYFGLRGSLSPCATDLISGERKCLKPTQHRESSCQYFDCNPIQGSNIHQLQLAEKHGDNSSEIPVGYANRSASCFLSQSFEVQHSPRWTGVSDISERFASSEDLLDQLEFVQFGRRARSKSFPLPQQNELAPDLDSETLREIDYNNNDPRPSTAKIKSATETGANWKYSHNKHVNVALGKNRFERQRGKSMNEAELSIGKATTRLSRSFDQLSLVADGGPTELKNALNRALTTPPKLLPSNQNWIKLKSHIRKPQTTQSAAATVIERGSDMTKSCSISYSAETLGPISPSPHLPPRKLGDWTYFLSGQEDVISENNGTDLCLASNSTCIQFNPSQRHPKNMFESSSLKIAANKEIEVTERTLSKINSPSLVNFVQMNPITNDTEHYKKDRQVYEASFPLCSDSSPENPLLASSSPAAKSEVKSESTKALLVKDNQSHTKGTSQQLSASSRNTVQLRLKMKSPEERRMEKLVKEILEVDRSLTDILDPNPTTKTIMDHVQGLFQEDTLVLEACQRRDQLNIQTTERETKRKEKEDVQFPSLLEPDTQAKVPVNINLMQNINKERGDTSSDVTEKKKELISTFRYKLQKLQEAKVGLHEDIKMNTLLGKDIEDLINDVCKPNEIKRYKAFIEDLDKVMNLLLCLSSRLVRVESALSKVNESTDMEEKQSLSKRHQTLSLQHEDARGFKEHQDHRERVTFRILTNYLTEMQLQQCHHFVQMRKALLIRQKEVEENLRLTEDQLELLENSL